MLSRSRTSGSVERSATNVLDITSSDGKSATAYRGCCLRRRYGAVDADFDPDSRIRVRSSRSFRCRARDLGQPVGRPFGMTRVERIGELHGGVPGDVKAGDTSQRARPRWWAVRRRRTRAFLAANRSCRSATGVRASNAWFAGVRFHWPTCRGPQERELTAVVTIEPGDTHQRIPSSGLARSLVFRSPSLDQYSC